MNTQVIDTLAGAITFWNTDKLSKLAVIEEALKDAGLDGVIVRERSDKQALHSALSEVVDQKWMIRPVKDSRAYSLVDESPVSETENGYKVMGSVRVNGDGDVHVSHDFEHMGTIHRMSVEPDGTVILSRLEHGSFVVDPDIYLWGDNAERQVTLRKICMDANPRFRYFRQHLSGGDVTAVLKAAAIIMGGCTARDHGSVYHLPEDACDRWEKLTQDIESAACSGGTAISVLRLRWTDRTVGDLKQLVTKQLLHRAAEIQDELIEKDFKSKDALEARALKLKRLSEVAANYGNVIGEAQDVVQMVISKAREMTGTVESAQSGQAYEDAFDALS